MFKKFTSLLVSVMLTLMLFSACGQTNSSSDKNSADDNDTSINIVTTIFAPYDFVRQISKNTDINLTMLIPPGTETHSYDPTTQDIIKISSCDLFIFAGGENDKWVEDILESLDTDVNTLRLIDCVSLYEEEIKEGMMEEEHEDAEDDTQNDSEDAEWDEHVWTSPQNAISIVEKISNEMSVIAPKNADIYSANASAYTKELSQLDDEFKSVVEDSERNTIIFADRFPARYFTEAYSLDYFAAFPGCASDSEPSAATVAFLIDKVKSENIPAVFYIELSNEKMADTICEATGAQKLLFHSCHNVSKTDFDSGVTYLSLMQQNLENVKTALN